MGVSGDKSKPTVSEPSNANDDRKVNPERRAALKKIGAYSAYVAPAMLVLMSSKTKAHHRPGHTQGPNCDNPGQHLGFNRNGHSAC